jgi:ABC-2 type transport system permease protein
MSSLNAFTAMVYRQLKRWWNNRSRIVMTVVNPLVWMVFLGLGWGGIFSPQNMPTVPGVSNMPALIDMLRKAVENYFEQIFGGVDYITFMVTGIVVMSAFMASFISGISVIWDKQFGFLKETLVAPAPRGVVILGRIVGDSIVASVQALLIALVSLLLTTRINLINTPIAILYVFITTLGFTALGTAISLKFSSMEGFQMIVNFTTMPLIFVSGVFYPVTTMPEWMKYVAMFNPLTYSVHAVRLWLAGASVGFDYMNALTDLAILIAFTAFMTIIAVKIFEKATVEE